MNTETKPEVVQMPKCKACGGQHSITPIGSPMDCLRYWRQRAITGESHARNSHQQLVEALQAVLAYEDDLPSRGTWGAEVYAKAQAALATATDHLKGVQS